MKRIIKIAENNVEVQTVYFDKKTGGKEVVVHTETYGQGRIDQETTDANNRKAAHDAFDKEVEKVKEDVELTELALIQVEMDK